MLYPSSGEAETVEQRRERSKPLDGPFEPGEVERLGWRGVPDRRMIRDAVLILKDAAIRDGVSDDVGAAIAALDLLTRSTIE